MSETYLEELFMFNNCCRSKQRQKRIEELEKRLWKLLETDFNNTIEPDQMLRMRREEQLINSGLAAMRLQQGEHRLANNLTIASLAFLTGIAGGIVGYLLRPPWPLQNPPALATQNPPGRTGRL